MGMKAEQASQSVVCDECDRMFRPNVVEEPTADGGARQTFSCVHCQAEFLVCTITARGLQLRDKLREAQRLAAAFREELAGEITSYTE